MTYGRLSSVIALVLTVVALSAQEAQQPNELFRRRYVEGQRLQYVMNAENNGNKYQVRITATTKRRNAEDSSSNRVARDAM